MGMCAYEGMDGERYRCNVCWRGDVPTANADMV